MDEPMTWEVTHKVIFGVSGPNLDPEHVTTRTGIIADGCIRVGENLPSAEKFGFFVPSPLGQWWLSSRLDLAAELEEHLDALRATIEPVAGLFQLYVGSDNSGCGLNISRTYTATAPQLLTHIL